jgi:hypothetical protein
LRFQQLGSITIVFFTKFIIPERPFGEPPPVVGNESELITKNVVDAMRTNQENEKKEIFLPTHHTDSKRAS